MNVVDLFTLESETQHPHGLGEAEFDKLFTKDKPVIFAFHGYPSLIHTLTYKRNNHSGFHVHGFKEEGTTTTPFDMVVLNELDRYSLALDAVSQVPRFKDQVPAMEQRFSEIMEKHKLYVTAHGEDLPEVSGWKWSPR